MLSLCDNDLTKFQEIARLTVGEFQEYLLSLKKQKDAIKQDGNKNRVSSRQKPSRNG